MISEKSRFSEGEIEKLKLYRDNQPDVRLKMRFVALLMLAEEISTATVESIIGKSHQTIERWVNQYRTTGIDSMNSFQYKPKKSFLREEQIDEVVRYVKEKNPSTSKEIGQFIKDKFQVEYSIEAVRKLLRKKGLKVLKPKTTPSDPPDEKTQIEFVRIYFLLKEMMEPGTVFLFGDAMHLVHQAIPGFCRGDPKDPPVLDTNCGRYRLNIIGAYNPDTYSLIHLTGEENCNAERVIQFLELIVRIHRKAPGTVLFLDNAKYFKARIVMDWLAKHPQLHLEFLPSYAPNLNLIERFWRLAKKVLVRNKFYKKYITFRAKVFQFLNDYTEYINQIKSLMVEKFQIIPTKTVPKQT